MARQIPIPVTELLDLPVALKGVSSALAPLYDQVRLSIPGSETGDLPLTDAEREAINAWFDSIGDWLGGGLPPTSVPPMPEVLRNAVDFDPDQQRLTLQLASLSERETSLAGMEGLGFVVRERPLRAIASLAGSTVTVSLSLDLALRLRGTTFEPMRAVTGGYEPDPDRTHTDIALPSVTVVVASDGSVTFPNPLNVQLPQPVRLIAAQNLLIEAARLFLDLASEAKFLAIRWESTQLSTWLGQVAPNFSAEGGSGAAAITLRLGLGDPIESVRLDWEFTDSRQNYRLPGIAIATPAQSRFTVLLKAEADSSTLNRFLFILTLPAADDPTSPGEQLLTAASSFAWAEEPGAEDAAIERELQNNSDPNAEAEADPLFKVDFIPTREVSLALLDWALTRPGLPTFLKQVEGGLPALDFDEVDSLRQGSELALRSLRADDWQVNPDFNTSAFDFPFLRNDQRDQRIQLNLGSPQVSLAETRIGLEAAAQVRIGSLLLNSQFDINFNWETFAITIDHGEGLRLLSAEEDIIPDKPYLGLTWRFKGAPAFDDNGEPILGPDGSQRYHHLTLVTKDYNYQVVQAPGAAIEIDYNAASEDPITFIVSNLAITDTGITLTAEVSDRPAKLNGLDTRFRFHGSRLEIVDNEIKDFTLAGSGPLPPDLVGEAIADIALQFSQRDGALTLVAGAANLRGNQLLKCQGTRFEFAIDALGLKFVNDGKFHLYFTLTGSAQFLPLPTDSPDGPLALLTGIKIQLVECPLTSDVSVIGEHVEFLIELPEKVSFSFLGCFEMEIRSIGFVPQFEEFDGAAAMEIGGQVKFAQGTGDVNTVQINFHSLFIGLPPRGSFFPRLYMQELEVNISLGEAFKLNAVVEFRNNESEQGFLGEGVMEIPGMPVFAASFAFLRVRRSESEPWVRAWFIFVEARQVSLYIPFVELYIREIGLGFGYRYTIASIKAADEEGSLSDLIGNLRELSRTQGDLSKRDRWSVDLEGPGESLRWTIVLRALISQTSATPGAISLKWLEHIEQTLPCLFLFDAVVAFRSDLTFFMAVRAWINSNYYDYVNDVNELRERPLFSGFVLLSVRQKRFLAQISSNPNGSMGTRPPLPVFVEQAVLNGQFAATILIEPALLHAELGWPNMLRWGQKIGPLDAEVSGGMIFRVSKHYLVLGISYKARGSLSFEAGLDLKIVGVRVSAHASFAWGARFIGLIDFADPTGKSALYAAIGIEIRIRIAIELWINLLFFKKTFRFSLEIGFTAGLELGLDGLTNAGLRGSGTLFISAMGRNFQVNVKLGINEGAVQTALDRTAPFLNVGLEASEVEPVPGLERTGAAPQFAAAQAVPMAAMVADVPEALAFSTAEAARLSPEPMVVLRASVATASNTTIAGSFQLPAYDLFVIRPRQVDEWGYFVLLPRAEVEGESLEDLGFLPVPPANIQDVEHDFELTLPTLPDGFTLQHFRPVSSDRWQPVTDTTTPLRWQVDWEAPIETATQYSEDGQVVPPSNEDDSSIRLHRYLTYAFKTVTVDGQDVPVEDPDPIATSQTTLADERVQNPSEGAYEAAVRGALEQFRSSPFFKHDPNSLYEQALEVAFRDSTSIYTRTGEAASGETGPSDSELLAEEQANQQAHQLRGLIVQDLIADLQDYADLPDLPTASGNAPQSLPPKDEAFVKQSIGFQMGLVFRYQISAGGTAPDWLEQANPTSAPSLKQRRDRLSPAPSPDQPSQPVRTFNVKAADFSTNPPQFARVQPLTDTNTIAIAWELTWHQPPEEGCSTCQRDPNQHLLHYQVRRRSLDGSEPEAVYTLKPAEGVCFEAHFRVTEAVINLLVERQILPSDSPNLATLRGLQTEFSGTDAFLTALRGQVPANNHPLIDQHQHDLLRAALQGDGGLLKRLLPRFQLVDHFTAETLEDQATMPATGRSYLYSITPIDFTKTPGRPLTLVATRYPSEPPRVPVDGEFIVEYQLTAEDWILAGDPDQPVMPEVIAPERISARWSDPIALRDGPTVPVAQYRLIFRKDTTLPIGSYGLDSSTQGPRSKTLPTTNARSLPTDIKIRLQPPGADGITTQALVTVQGVADPVELSLPDALQQAGILPSGTTPQWRPEAWQVFLQTESVNGVPSALAPVKLLLQFTTAGGINPEERQPAQLEWLPKPLRLPMLPPEDSRIVAGLTHVPMPGLGTAALFNGTLEDVGFRPHPAQLRLLRLRWNQGPSHQPQYPLNLNASYTLLELDVDAHTNQTFRSTARLADALREIQQVQLLPAEDLVFTPQDTQAANQWEAWYPSQVRRLEPVSEPVEGDQRGQSPWYSWRESHLVWPAWPSLTDPTQRAEALHPFLQALVETLDENPQGYLDPITQQPLTTYNVNVQFGPPRLAGDFKAFRELTAATADPYGWSILLRLGLSIGLTLRDERTNDLITGEPLLLALHTTLTVLRLDAQTRLLQLLLETLAENFRGYRNPQTGQPLTTYNVEVPAGLPRELIDLTSLPDLAFPLATLASGRFLLPLALDLTLNLSAKGTNQPITGAALEAALQTALNAIVADPQNTQDVLIVAHWPVHLFVELLVQPGRCFSPEPGSLAADSLLAMVQLSLRPRIEPYLDYGVITLQGPARSQVELVIGLDPGIAYTLIDQGNAAAGEQTLPPPGQPLATSILQPVTLPLNGRTRLLLRYPSGKPPRIEQLRFPLNQAIAVPDAAQPGLEPRTTRILAAFASAFPGLSLFQVLANSGFTLDNRAGGSLQVPILAFRSFQADLTDRQRQALRELLQISLSAQDAGVANALVDLTITSLETFPISDPRSTYFRIPADLAADLANVGLNRGQQWRQMALYLESINSTDPTLPAIVVPTDEASIAKILPDVLAWAQRFFDASGDHPDQAAGPWLVTAYSRISTPSYASPDASGRLKYDHLLSDRWAHNYRYYIRPSSRYDLLWQSLLESPDLFPRPLGQAPQPRRELDTFVLSARSLADLEGKLPPTVVDAVYPLENQRYIGESRFLAAVATVAGTLSDAQRTTLLAAVETFSEALPDPQAGGSDITIERSQPIDKPLVLSSSRLDAASSPSNPAAPGRTWEVMVAQHWEQRLAERNQTLVRRLAYRQIAFTLLRRFAYHDWPRQLTAASDPTSGYQLQLKFVENHYPALPSAYPTQPDHLDVADPTSLAEADVRSLALPLRNGNFQQGTLTLQWEALPFFYEHSLLLIAQSASTVSEPNQLVQRDFEYLTPQPVGNVGSDQVIVSFNNRPALSIRTRRVSLPLQRFWDALPAAVRAQWPIGDAELAALVNGEWPSEAPPPKDSTIPHRNPASLPDPEVIYQLVELYSGNLEVQVEYFFDPITERYALRQLGQRFLGELETLSPPTSNQPQADYVLETRLHQVHEIRLQRPGYFSSDSNRISLGTTESKVLRRQAPALFVVGVFDRRDRVNLLLNSVPDLRQFSVFPGSQGDLATQEAFLAEWYSTRVFANPPVDPPRLTEPILVDGVAVTLPDLVDYPEVPKPATIPAELRARLTIRVNEIVWQGTMMTAEADTLSNYRLSLPDHQSPAKTAINGILEDIQTAVATAPYPVPERRPHPADNFLGTFAIAVTFPPADNPNWALGWTGPMDQATEDALRSQAQPYSETYRNGIDALIRQVQSPRWEGTGISLNRPSIPPIPFSLSRKFSVEVGDSIDDRPPLRLPYTVIWQGSMTDDEANTLRDIFFRDTQIGRPNTIVAGVNQVINQALNDPNRNATVTQTISFAWPRPDQLTPSQRQALIGNPLAGLSVDEAANQLGWRRADNLDLAAPELVNLVRSRLQPGDPFIEAFQTLITRLDRAYSRPMRLRLLRLRGLLTPTEQTALRQLFSNHQTNLEALLADVSDLATVEQLYTSGFSQEPISAPIAIPDGLNQVLDFPTPRETVLIWRGGISAAERDAALGLPGDEAFTTALEQLTRRRLIGEELPEELRTQLQILRNTTTGEETLTWQAPGPTNAQILLLQALVVDAAYEASLRRLIRALLEDPSRASGASVPLAAFPDVQRITLPLPEEGTSRPTTATLPEPLQGKLLIGNAVIRYHGLMTVAEGVELRSRYSHPSDRAAIERLFQASTQQGLNGRELRLQARRGSAAPSPLIALTPQSLPQD